MAYIAEFALPDGERLYVEAADLPREPGEQRAAIESIGKFLSRGPTESLPDLASRVSPIISALKTIKEKLAQVGNPDQVELEAGLKFVGEAGVVLSKVGSEASVSIKLVWKRTEARE